MDLRNLWLWGAASASVAPPALTDLHLPLIWSAIDQTVFMPRCLCKVTHSPVPNPGWGGGGISKKHFWSKNKGRAGTLGPLSWIRHCSQPCRVAMLVTPSNYIGGRWFGIFTDSVAHTLSNGHEFITPLPAMDAELYVIIITWKRNFDVAVTLVG